MNLKDSHPYQNKYIISFLKRNTKSEPRVEYNYMK